jgi:AhpD family alkylhydroperoxidase
MKCDGRTNMEEKIKWLIAAGAAFNANCQPCLKTIFKKALEAGASKKEIAEAIGVAKLVRRNATTFMDKFVAGLTETEIGEISGNTGCGCS